MSDTNVQRDETGDIEQDDGTAVATNAEMVNVSCIYFH